MPLPTAMARLAKAAEFIRSRTQADGTLRYLCEDHRLARETFV